MNLFFGFILKYVVMAHLAVMFVCGLISACYGTVIGNYLRKNHREIWKKSWSFWIPTRIKAVSLLHNTDDPVLKKMVLRQEKYLKILLYTALSLTILFCIVVLTVFMSDTFKS